MNIKIIGRKIEVTEGLKTKIESKLSKLDKFFQSDSDAQVKLSAAKDRHCVEVTIYQQGFIFRAEETGRDMYAVIDIIVDVLERQIRKNKTRLSKKIKASAFSSGELSGGALEPEETEFNVIKTKRVDVKPMSIEEAILQMNMLGHEFFLFSNDKTGAANVVYKRKDGNYGLLDATHEE